MQSRRIRVEIRRVFLDTWDPIGIRDEPNAQDEYDGYIGEVFELLANGSPDSKILDYLFEAAHEHMGLSSSRREDMLPTVVELRKINFSPVDNSQDSHT
jgi:hypothetical protein